MRTPRNTLAESAFADPCPRARPIPIVPDHMQVREELVRWHTFALPRVCSRAHVPHIHAQPSKMRGTGLIATIATRIPTIHTCRCVEARTIAHVPWAELHNEHNAIQHRLRTRSQHNITRQVRLCAMCASWVCACVCVCVTRLMLIRTRILIFQKYIYIYTS